MLIRKLLAYKHRPALIVLHWWSPQTREFWQSAEDELEVFSKCVSTLVIDGAPMYQAAPCSFCCHWIADGPAECRYYRLPSLSWRDAAHDLLANNVSGFKFEDIYFDRGHPNGYNGHRHGLHGAQHV